jgi:hypothetical protein
MAEAATPTAQSETERFFFARRHCDGAHHRKTSINLQSSIYRRALQLL